MPEFVDNTVKDIDEQLRQLRDEVSRLEAARSALTGGRRRPGRPRGSATRATGARTTRARATRAQHPFTGEPPPNRATHQHAFEYPVHPWRPEHARGPSAGAGSSAARHHDSAGCRGDDDPAQYLYRLLPRLSAEGEIKRNGQARHPAS